MIRHAVGAPRARSSSPVTFSKPTTHDTSLGRRGRRPARRPASHGEGRGNRPIQICVRLSARTSVGHGRVVGLDRTRSQGDARLSIPRSPGPLRWFKSSHSGANTTECVEAACPGGTATPVVSFGSGQLLPCPGRVLKLRAPEEDVGA
ncbi:DUF397 domain-containing protein [Streptomyces sp. P8-A8]|uniref:DUF397 domain-containing protein n=1 Tax=Streptomyces sp. P8-A8 TaxID=3029759 RepID=UPI0036DADBCE